jgi:2-polyprenyl-6-methoxyphenol hydroxylase-like FAD-dependent oxidoreductase
LTGVFGGLLFEQFGFDFVIVEKFTSPRPIYSSHWLSANSKAVLRQVAGLVEEINRYQLEERLEYYRYFRYVENLFGQQLALTDHFQPSVEKRLQENEAVFGERPSHIPQTALLNIMLGMLRGKERVLYGHEIKALHPLDDGQGYLLINQNNAKIVKAQYVILCDGGASGLREWLLPSHPGFKLEGKENMMGFVNIYFSSKKLAERIISTKSNAMLHFIYNSKMMAVLINLAVAKEGIFMLQVVNYEPYVNLLQVYQAKELLKMMFEGSESYTKELLADIYVISVSKSESSALLAMGFYSKGIFLAGDGAHSLPTPANFGSNLGLQDMHELVHTLLMSEQNPHINP